MQPDPLPNVRVTGLAAASCAVTSGARKAHLRDPLGNEDHRGKSPPFSRGINIDKLQVDPASHRKGWEDEFPLENG